MRWYTLGFREVSNNLRQAFVLAARINLLDRTLKPIAFGLERGQPRVSSADVTRKYHTIFLQCRPSRSMRSSDSLGPHEPDA